MSSPSYKEHYKKYLEVYENLATVNGGKTVWIPTDAHDGWYITEPVQDENSKAWKEGYPNKSRPSILPDDLDADVDRTAYTTISYAPSESYKDCYFRETDGEIEWMDGDSDRLPDYGSISAWALFVDIDIHDKYKKRPLPDTHKEVIEQRLSLWIDAFSEMAGDIDGVMSLDSGGGMYVFVPPCAMSSVADRYNEKERNLIFNEIGKRVRTVTGKLDELICQQDNAPDELFSADKVQNKNRQFKTIGAIHKDLDSVVYPINPKDIHIQNKPVESISDSDIQEANQWVKNFTSDRHRERVGSIINYLFQGQFTKKDDMNIDYIDGNTWDDILDNWVEDKKESIEMWEEARQERSEMTEETLKTELTQDKEVAREALRRVNNRKLKQYIVDFLGTSNVYQKSGEEMDFFPFWRSGSTESGRSAFYDYYEGKARFTDKADGTSRDLVYWVALEMTYDDENYPDTHILDAPGDDLDAADYRRCIDEIRNRGENIPILVQSPEDDNGLPDYQIRRLGVELGIVSEDDIVKNDGDEKLKADAWNRVLERLENEDIVHNRKYRKPLAEIKPPDNVSIYSPMGHYYEEFNSREHYEDFLENLPEYVIPFIYEGDTIAGGEPNGVMGGVFESQDDNQAVLSRLEPQIVEIYDLIDTYDDLTIEVTEKLDKDKLKILTNDRESL